LVSLIVACGGAGGRSRGGGGPDEAGEGRFGALPLVVYSSAPRELARFLVDEYRDRTGAPILLMEGSMEELLGRIRDEAADPRPGASAPRADILWTEGGAGVDRNPGLFEAWVPRGAGSLPAEARDPDGRWTAFAAVPSPQVVALVREAPNAGAARAFIEFLLDPGTGRALAARFSASGNAPP
jgi:ABC-type Fe3+ transport system substrate-binding protein